MFMIGGVPAAAQAPPPLNPLDEVAFEQRLNEQVPMDLPFRDATGQMVRLGDYFGDKPIILVLAYYECPNLCTLVLNGLADSLREIPFTIGDEFAVITVSINPRETPEFAATKQESYVRYYGRGGAAADGWHFLTGDESAIQRLASAVGFEYAYDPRSGEYAHPSGVMVLTPEGVLSRYFFGISYAPLDMRLGLVEASANKIGSPVDELLLRCFSYDPVRGQYTLLIMNVIRLAGIATVLVLGAFMVVMFRMDRRPRS